MTFSYSACQFHPSDKGLFEDNISSMEIKKNILASGSSRPEGPFPKDANNRSFSENYYFTKKSAAGNKVPRYWLCYSAKLNCAYCEPCWLFADRCHPSFHPSWIQGINDWQGLSKKIKVHEQSHIHLNASIAYDMNKNNETLEYITESTFKENLQFWRNTLTRIIDVILHLAILNIPFRGHRENMNDPNSNSGNFLGIINLLAKYDRFLGELVQKHKHKTRYLSPKIQNELITLLGNSIRDSLIKIINHCQFFTIILDTTQDISKKDQLSVIIRYVTIINDGISGNPVDIQINETFLGFHEITDQTGSGISDFILSFLESNSIPISKCRGQGYDGAANMRGVYSGVQMKIKNQQPYAEYVHCASHNLNLILQDSCNHVEEIRNYYDQIQTIYNFFGHSIKRWNLLICMQNSTLVQKQKRYTLKTLSSTRWSSRFQTVTSIKYNYSIILKTVTKIILTSSNAEEKRTAQQIKNKMETFEFVLLTVLQAKILENVNIVSNLLQSKNMDLHRAVQLLDNCRETLVSFRNQYDEFFTECKNIARSWNTTTECAIRRVSRTRKHFDELAQDERICDPKKRFEICVFNGSLDIIISQIRIRFESMRTVNSNFNILDPKGALLCEDNELFFTEARKLVEAYPLDLSNEFLEQLLLTRNALKSQLRNAKSTYEAAKIIIVDFYCTSICIPEVCSAYILYLTLPVTTASAERSFSKLKLIKNYLRSTMTQTRLSSLAFINIENKMAREIDINIIVEEFAEKNARRRLCF